MDIKISFNQEHQRKDRSRLFNLLGKATTALSIPLMFASVGTVMKELYYTVPHPTTPITIFGHRDPVRYGLLGTIMLSSLGLLFRRQSIFEKNLQPHYVTNSDKMAELHQEIEHEKNKWFADDGSFFDKAVKEGKPVRFPTIEYEGRIFPFLMMSPADIEKLPPLNKCVSYIAQIRCMNHYIEEQSGEPTSYGYAPDIPVAQRSTLISEPFYRFDDILEILKRDHDIATSKLAKICPDGLRLDVSETVQEHKIISDLNKQIPVNGLGVAFTTVVFPIIPAIYGPLNAVVSYAGGHKPLLTDTSHTYNILSDLEYHARAACGLPRPESKRIKFETNYSDVRAKLNAAPALPPALPNI